MESKFPVLQLTGTPRERGRAHGESLRAQINAALEQWYEDLERTTEVRAPEYLGDFVMDTRFQAAIRHWTPDLWDEIEGLAEGANVDFNTIFAWQLMDEEWWYRKERLTSAAALNHCSALGVFGEGGAPLLAQNMDIYANTDGYQTLLHIKDGGVESFVFTFAGFLGLTGLNNYSLGVCCNTLSSLNHSADGLPVAFIIRHILAQKSRDDSVAFVRDVKHASGQNYLIGDKDGIQDFECSANRVCEYLPSEGATRVFHTNHPLVNDDYGEPRAVSSINTPVPTNSEIRYNLVEKGLAAAPQVDVKTIESILSTRPVCVERGDRGDLFTAGSLIMSLGSSPDLLFAPGPPSMKEYQLFSFS